MERESATPSLHRLLGEAVTRSALAREESRAAIEATRAAMAALEVTVAEIHRRRARRTFGNGHVDAADPEGPG